MKPIAAVIIGAGQSGLAMSRELSGRGVDHLILERGAVANSWRTERWDSLTLLTPNWANGLPDAPYEGAFPNGFMPVSELVERFEAYALDIDAPIEDHTTVTKVTRSSYYYLIDTDQGPVKCETLVLATGACNRAKIPAISTAMPSGLFQTTPLAYKRPDDLPDGGVLMVGASASGVQLAREIHSSGRPVTLAVGNHTRLPRSYRGKDIEWWLNAIGMNDVTIDRIDDLQRARRTPSPQLIGGVEPVDLNALQDLGVEIVGRIADSRDGHALFSGSLANVCASADLKMNRLLKAIDDWIAERGLEAEFSVPEVFPPTRLPASPRLRRNLTDGGIRSILWATGYTPNFSWLDVPVLDGRARIRHQGGVVDAPGLYVMGLPIPAPPEVPADHRRRRRRFGSRPASCVTTRSLPSSVRLPAYIPTSPNLIKGDLIIRLQRDNDNRTSRTEFGFSEIMASAEFQRFPGWYADRCLLPNGAEKPFVLPRQLSTQSRILFPGRPHEHAPL